MITDKETNFVYFSSLFHKWYPIIAGEVFRSLAKHNINIIELEGTKDIWCRDYLPVQVSENDFVQFKYDPPYLRVKKHEHLRTDPKGLYDQLKISKPTPSDLIIDGGQVIKEENRVIVSGRVTKWNKDFGNTEEIRTELWKIFKVDEVIFLQPQPFDFTSHMDGLIRFLDDHNVIISDFRREEEWYKKSIKGTLNNYKITPHFMPVAYKYSSQNEDSAVGIYMNYLHVGNIILFPIFGMREDYDAYNVVMKLYPGYEIIPINCKVLAEEGGGILNCVSWNIKIG